MLSNILTPDVLTLGYLLCSVLFILGIKGLAHPKTALRGNTLAMVGMVVAMVLAALDPAVTVYGWMLAGVAVGGAIGLWQGRRVKMTDMPQWVAYFNGFVGLAAALVTGGEYLRANSLGTADTLFLFNVVLSLFIGLVTFSGSMVAGGKLAGWAPSRSIKLPLGHISTLALLLGCAAAGAWLMLADGGLMALGVLAVLSLAVGLALVFPIGGADMPVVVSLFNAYSGWASVLPGFMLGNLLLVVAGTLVGASGTILTMLMCAAMNRSFMNVLLGGFGADDSANATATAATGTVRQAGVDDVAFMMSNSRKVVLVPGYGMAVAQAQHALKDVMLTLEAKGVEVRFAIHPVAGRMP
ncbi:MAG: NAD(P)(+) transhydrogenase (Re/Si-specific) subunit beta, partial [Alphaproteobacteria bacterium]